MDSFLAPWLVTMIQIKENSNIAGAQGWEIEGFCVTLDGAPYLHGCHKVLVPLSLIPLAVFKAF